MDTTKEYIQMCEKATEMQEKWIPNTGDSTLQHYEGKPKSEWTDYDYSVELVNKISGSSEDDDLCSPIRVKRIKIIKKEDVTDERTD